VVLAGAAGDQGSFDWPIVLMKPHFQRLFYRWGYTSKAFGLLDLAVRTCGRSTANRVARTVATFYTATNPGIVETVRQNLLLLDPAATARQARSVFQNFAVGLSDYWIAGNVPIAEAASWCTDRAGWNHLETALQHGRGAVLATGHFGLFEYGALLLAEKKLPVTVLTLSEPTRELTDWRADFRRRWGAETIEIGQEAFSSLKVVETLKQNRFCALLVDRPFHGPSLGCPLPNGEMPFSLSAALLAYLAECPIIPVSTHRRADASYALRAHHPIFPERTKPRQENLEEMTRKMAAVLAEDFVGGPEHWFHFCPIHSST
jgi:KDO2-lipid IV(A) lauroyltransferase